MTDFVHFPRPGKNDPYVPSASLLRMRTTPHQPPVSLRCRNLPLSLAWADHRKPHLHLPATPCEDKYHRNVCFPQAQRSFGSFPKIHPKWSKLRSLKSGFKNSLFISSANTPWLVTVQKRLEAFETLITTEFMRIFVT